MEFFDNIREGVKNFIEKNNKLTLILVIVFVVFFVSGLFVGLSKVSLPESHKKVTLPDDTSFKAADSFFAPEKTKLLEDYYFSRQTKEKWNDEDISRWFSKPDSGSFEKLEKANDKVIDEILGAAP